MADRLYGLGEVVRMTKILAHRINYALDSKYLSEPKHWVSNKRAWTKAELTELAKYFGSKVDWEAADKIKN